LTHQTSSKTELGVDSSRENSTASEAVDLTPFIPNSAGDWTELGLRFRALPLAQAFAGRLPSRAELREATQAFGVEIASAMLHQAVREAKPDGAFLREVFATRATDIFSVETRELASEFEVTIVASQLMQSGRKWGDHVERWRMLARSQGFTTDSIDTRADASVAENARLILRHLSEPTRARRIIVTYGQGALELRRVLQAEGEKAERARASIAAWINVCGAVYGSTSSQWLRRTWWSSIRSQVALQRSGRHSAALVETDAAHPLVRADFWSLPLPSVADWHSLEFPVVNFFGLPYQSQLPRGLNRTYLELSRLEPNDGAVLASEAIVLGGLALPVSGMSHRAEGAQFEPVYQRLLVQLARRLAKASAAARPHTSGSN
jgi:hypothetical protein